MESKVNKTTRIICKIENVLPRSSLLTIYKSFIRSHLDYGDIIYVKHLMSFFTLGWKVLINDSPSNLFNTIPNSNKQHQTRNSGNITSFFVKHDYFKNSFFPSAITEWNKLDCYISSTNSFKVFNKGVHTGHKRSHKRILYWEHLWETWFRVLKIKKLVQKNEFFVERTLTEKFLKVTHRQTFLILYQIVIRNIEQEIQATLPLSSLNMIILRILFSLLQ